MASRQVIYKVLRRLQLAGMRFPREWGEPKIVEDQPVEWDVLDVWENLLGDVTDQEFGIAALAFARRPPKGDIPLVPSVGEVVAEVQRIRKPLVALAPEDVFAVVMANVNAYSTPEKQLAGKLPDEDLLAALFAIETFGGWRALCGTLESELPHTRRTFSAYIEQHRGRVKYVEQTTDNARLLELRAGVAKALTDRGEWVLDPGDNIPDPPGRESERFELGGQTRGRVRLNQFGRWAFATYAKDGFCSEVARSRPTKAEAKAAVEAEVLGQ